MRSISIAATLLTGCLHAQIGVDSLLGAWQDPALPDTLRLNAVGALIEAELETANAALAAEHIEAMAAFAQARDIDVQLGRAFFLRSQLHRLAGRTAEELADLRLAQARFDAAGALKESALNHGRIARCFRRMGLMDSTIVHAEASLVIEKKRGDPVAIGRALLYLGGTYLNTGDQQLAGQVLMEARTIADREEEAGLLARVEDRLGYLNFRQKDLEQAMAHYRQGYAAAVRAGDAEARGLAMMRFGDVLMDQQRYDSSKFWLDSSLVVNEAVGSQWQTAAVLNSLGSVEERQGRFEEAAPYWERSLAIRRTLGDPYEITLALTNLSYLDISREHYTEAIRKATEALDLSERTSFERGIQEATLRLYMAYKGSGDFAQAMRMYERHIQVRDSSLREENQRELIRQEYRYTYEKQALSDSLSHAAELAVQTEEVRRQKVVRNGFMGGFALLAVFATVFLFQRNRIGKEKARSEELLLNILPEEVAEELKEKGSAKAKLIDQATVLFTDFKGFTAYSENLSPEQLVHDLNECFTAFDNIMAKHGLEKIKTIGDAYMAAGGLPAANSTHALDTVKAALEIRDIIAEGKARKMAAGLPYFEIRIGIHTGPVVAGIVGVKKFSYDIWGDTVNMASRMESSGEVGQVNISEATYVLVKDEPGLTFTPRGRVSAKGKGELEMYFVQ